MSGKRSRDKGNRGELQVRDLWHNAGFQCERVPNSGGLWIPGDVAGIDGLHIEVKLQKRPRVFAAMEQAIVDCPLGEIASAWCKPDRGEWYVTVLAKDFIPIWKASREQR